MQKYMTKRVVRNICQLIIGWIMLWLSYNYVQAHDAERTNFISGLTVLKQKATHVINSIFGDESVNDMSRQQDMLRSYKELASYLEKSECTISIPLADVHERLQLLMTMTATEYKNQALSYSSFASQVYTEMQQKCKK